MTETHTAVTQTEEGAAPLRDCPACGAARATRIDAYSPDPWEVAACDDCGFVFLRNPPGYQALVEDFAWERSHAERTETRKGSTPLSGLNRKLRKALGTEGGQWRQTSDKAQTRYLDWFGPGRVLDIGCGGGDRVEAPMIPYGIELSKSLQEVADARMRALGGYCLHAPGAEGLDEFEADFFDGVLMFSYLEHEAQVLKTLTGVHRVLKPGGKAFVRVPNFACISRRVIGARWCGFRWPDHVNYFTYGSLRDIAGRLGFTTTLVNRLRLPFDDNVQALLAKN